MQLTLSLAIMQLPTSVAIMQLEVFAIIMPVKISATDMWARIFIEIMQVGVCCNHAGGIFYSALCT